VTRGEREDRIRGTNTQLTHPLLRHLAGHRDGGSVASNAVWWSGAGALDVGSAYETDECTGSGEWGR
jgi:hypothetical protein